MGPQAKLMLHTRYYSTHPPLLYHHTTQPINTILMTASTTRRYETILILRPDIPEEEKTRQLAKFEALLENEGAESIHTTIKGIQRMSYPMKGYRDGIYILYRYDARGTTANVVQKNLANPDAETQGNILRWVNFRDSA